MLATVTENCCSSDMNSCKSYYTTSLISRETAMYIIQNEISTPTYFIDKDFNLFNYLSVIYICLIDAKTVCRLSKKDRNM